MIRVLLLGLSSLLAGCTGLPKGVEPVTGFELDRYLGTWYEIARLDHRFERGLTNVSAEYSRRDDGGIKVINSGYDSEKQRRRSAEGRAYFIENPDVGRIKVSFFGPFFGAYNIIALDKTAYSYVMITGNTRDYLWIMARSPSLENPVLKSLLDQAKSLGFSTEDLIYPQIGH